MFVRTVERDVEKPLNSFGRRTPNPLPPLAATRSFVLTSFLHRSVQKYAYIGDNELEIVSNKSR